MLARALCQEPDIDLLPDLGVTAVGTAAEHGKLGKAVDIDQAVHRFSDSGFVIVVYDDTVIDIRRGKHDGRMLHLFFIAALDAARVDILHTAETDDESVEPALLLELINSVINAVITAVTGLFILRSIIAAGDDDQVQITSLADTTLDIRDKLRTVIGGSILKDQSDRSFFSGVFDHEIFRPFLFSSSKALTR